MTMSYKRLARVIFSVVFLAGAALLATGFYMQYARDIYPCNLCLLQRFLFMAAAAVALVAALHGARAWGVRIYALLLLLFSSAGIATAGRQVWLQSLPADQVPACGMGLEYMMKIYPLFDALWRAFKGSGDCAKVQWQFLGLSIPSWSLLSFCCATLLALLLLLWRRN